MDGASGPALDHAAARSGGSGAGASDAAASAGVAAPFAATPAARAPGDGPALRLYGLLTWAAVLVHLSVFLVRVKIPGPGVAAFAALVLVTYAAFFTILAGLPIGTLHLALRRVPAARWVVLGAAVLVPALLQLVLFADHMILGMYGFHLNGMVWNLLVTPGGIESLGAGSATNASVAIVVLLCIALQAVLLAVAMRLSGAQQRIVRATTWRRVASAFGCLVLAHGADRVTFLFSYAASDLGIVAVADAIPQYGRTRAKSLWKKEGSSDGEASPPNLSGAVLDYPRAKIVRAPGAPAPNIVWLVSESLRADMLDPEIMPATTEFARGGRRYMQHYSAGNGTRMGVFGMFYGLCGSYWFPVVASTRGPVLVDTLLDSGYDIDCYTSALFTYPEFDRTVWQRIPKDRLHEGDPKIAGWKNDQRNVDLLLASIDAAPEGRPFFRFLFFESPHAPYRFPEAAALRSDFEREMNYVTMDLSDPDVVRRIKTRYVNACHALDAQLARVYAHLEEKGLLENTIVVVTGDHGEEFMEKGRWGHHSAFTDEQIRTPLVIRAPGFAPGVEERITSHLDLPATILARLGVTNPSSDYSLGVDILSGARTAPALSAGWSDMGFVDDDCKIVLPFSGVDSREDDVTRRDDSAIPDAGAKRALRASKNEAIVQVMRDMRRFLR